MLQAVQRSFSKARVRALLRRNPRAQTVYREVFVEPLESTGPQCPYRPYQTTTKNTLEDNAIEPHIALGKYEVKSRGVIVYRINSLEFAFGIYCLVVVKSRFLCPKAPAV